jgi:hypothetical protein
VGTETTLGTSSEDGSFSTEGKLKGAADVSPKRDSTYVVRCRGKNDKELARDSCRITVEDAGQSGTSAGPKTQRPTVRFINVPESVEYGGSVRVEWRSTHAARCLVYGPGCKRFGRTSDKCFKETGLSGYVTGNLYETSEFEVECRGADPKQTTSDSVEIQVYNDSDSSSGSATSRDSSRDVNIAEEAGLNDEGALNDSETLQERDLSDVNPTRTLDELLLDE